MKRHKLCLLLAAAAFAGFSAPALAQLDHSNMPGMNMPGMKMPAKKKPAAKKPAAKKPAARKPAAKKATTSQKSTAATARARRGPSISSKKKAARPANPHAGRDMSSMPGMEMPSGQPMQGHDMSSMPAQQQPAGTDRQAGQDMSNMPGMTMPQGQTTGQQMPGHDMPSMPGMQMPQGQQMPGMEAPAGTDLAAGNAPPPPLPTDHAADRVYDPAAMAMGRHHLGTFHGNQKLLQALWNVAEYQARKGRDGYEWDGEAWYGGDINRLWLKSQGEGQFGRPLERAEAQALYSHAIDPYFNVQAGLRYDFKPNPSRVYATVGIEGLAPSFFELGGALFLSNKGELLARAEGYYDQRITQRLILQPRAELNFAAQSIRELGVGTGLSDAELGLRLRYDIRREFAPYVGVQYSRAFGARRRFLRDQGEDASDLTFVVGLRTWF